MENRHWEVIVKFQLFSLSLLTHISLSRSLSCFCKLRLVYSSSILRFSDHHEHIKRQWDNKSSMCYFTQFFLSWICFKKTRTPYLGGGGEFMCACPMYQKWTKWPLWTYNSDPVVLWTLVSFVLNTARNKDERNHHHNRQPCGSSDLSLVFTNVGSTWPVELPKSVN